MNESVERVIIAYKRRFVRKVKRRSPAARLKSRTYYRTHKSKIRLQRRRYLRKNKLFMRSRKLFKRMKPHWLSPKRTKAPTSKSTGLTKHNQFKKPKKLNITKPTKPRIRKINAPKRRTTGARPKSTATPMSRRR